MFYCSGVTAIGELGEQEGDWGLCSRRSLWEGGGTVAANLFLHERWRRRVSFHKCQDRREWDCVFYQIKLLDSDMRITNFSYKSSDLLNESFYPNDEIQQISLRYVRKGVSGE